MSSKRSADVIKLLDAKAQAAAKAAALDFQGLNARQESAPAEGAGLVAFRLGDHAELAEAVLGILADNRSRLIGAEGRIWCYSPTEGVWSAKERDALRKIVKSFSGAPKGENGALRITAAATEGALMLAHAEVAKARFFDDAPRGVAFLNGFAKVEGGEVSLREHSPQNRCRHGHAFAYDPAANRGPLERFLGELFGDQTEAERAARIALLQEFTGACLTGLAPSFQQCLVMQSPGGEGKSTALRVMAAALPDGTTVSLPPQLWAERFQLIRLGRAQANFCDELPEREFLEAGAFKAVVAGETVHVERKHQDSFETKFRCGHAFATNKLPGTNDLTEGFFRRFVLLPFSRRFAGTSGCKRDAAAEVIKACRPGLAAWALEGAARLQRQGGYTIPDGSHELMTEWRKECDSVALFVDEKCKSADVAAGEKGTRSSVLFREYRTWCQEQGYRAVSAKTFKGRLEALGHYLSKQADGNYYPLWLKPEAAP